MSKQISIRDYLIGLGLPGAVVAIGFAMTGYLNFWFGICAAVGGVLWFVFDWLRMSRERPIWIRTIGVGIAIAVLSWIGWIALRPAQLDFTALIPPGEYPAGTNVSGIKWQSGYSAIEAAIINETDLEFTDVTLRVRTNWAIAEISSTGDNDCKTSPDIPFMGATLSIHHKDGHIISEPLFRSNQKVTATSWYVRCDRIIAHLRENLELAVVPLFISGPQSLQWVIFFAKYKAAYRDRESFSPLCLLNKCDDIPLTRLQAFHNEGARANTIVP